MAFEARRTELQLMRWGTDSSQESIRLVFDGVEFQEFRGFAETTVLTDLAEASSWAEFMTIPWHAHYFQTRANYLSGELLSRLATSNANRFFALASSCGFEGLVVCKHPQLSNLSE
jgi:hypothetical protein